MHHVAHCINSIMRVGSNEEFLFCSLGETTFMHLTHSQFKFNFEEKKILHLDDSVPRVCMATTGILYGRIELFFDAK